MERIHRKYRRPTRRERLLGAVVVIVGSALTWFVLLSPILRILR